MFEDQKNLYNRLATNVVDENTTSRRPYESIEDLVEADEPIKSVGSINDEILLFNSQLGADLLPGSSLVEAFGFRPDFIKGEGYTSSYPELAEETKQLYKEEKKAEAIGKGIETGLVGVGAVGEGMMLAGALTGPLAPVIIGSGLALKGISKAGKLILESKTGIKLLANFTGNKNSPNIQNIEIPKDISPDSDLQKIIQNEKIPTTVTDDVDTVDYIPENLKALNAEEVITTYITMPEKITRNQVITHPAITGKDNVNPNIMLDFDTATDRTNKYLKEKGFDEGSNVPVYRLIKYKVKRDKTGNIIGRENYQDTETLISGSLTPEANLKTLDFFTQSDIDVTKMGRDDMYEIVKYNVPQDKIKLAMGAYKNNITSSINKQLKNKNIIAEPEKGFKKVNPAEDAKKLIDIQDEVIADVSNLDKIKLGSFSSYQDLKNKHIDKIIFNKIKNIDDYKNQIKKDFDDGRIQYLTRDEIFKSGKSKDELLKMQLERAAPDLDKVTRFYNKSYVTDQPASTLEISQNPTFSRLEEAVNNLKQKKGSGEVFLNRLKGQAKKEERDWIGLTKFLKGKKEVTKEQIQQYVKQNSIPIEEAVYSNNPKDIGYKGKPQYSSYTIDGDNTQNLKNYREFVFSIPQRWRERNLDYPLTNKEEVRLAELEKIGNKYVSNTPRGLTIEYQGLKNKLENYENKNKPIEFIPSHNYADKNLISRVRVADRIDSDGKPTVHIEEVQSEYVGDVLNAKKKAQKDADSFYIGTNPDSNLGLQPGITEKDIEILRKGYAPPGIKFREKKTFQDLIANEKAIAKRLKELENKHIINLDDTRKYIEVLNKERVSLEQKITFEPITNTYTPYMRNEDQIKLNDINDQLANEKTMLNEFDNIYKKDKVIKRLSYKSRSLQNRNRLNLLLKDLPPEFPVLSVGKKDDFYKFDIDRIIRDAAERDIPSITLPLGRVQYNRYAKGSYETQINKIRARDKMFRNFNSFLKEGSTIDISNARALSAFQVKYNLHKIPPQTYTKILGILQKYPGVISSKGKETIKKLIDDVLLIHRSAKVGNNYDTKYVGYLNDIAKKYNAKRDTTFVDNNFKDGISFRLEITPQMKKDYLKKGAARFKTGGYIEERI